MLGSKLFIQYGKYQKRRNQKIILVLFAKCTYHLLSPKIISKILFTFFIINKFIYLFQFCENVIKARIKIIELIRCLAESVKTIVAFAGPIWSTSSPSSTKYPHVVP